MKTLSKKKRKEIEEKIYETFSVLDRTNKNTEHYKKLFSNMTDAQFQNYFERMFKSEDNNFFLEVLPYENEPTLKDIKKAADKLNIPLEEYVYLYDPSSGKYIRTKEKMFVGYLLIKKMQQMLEKKNTFSIDISERSGKTQHLVGKSKIARITDLENIALLAFNAENASKEFLGPKADDIKNKMVMYKQINTEGYFSIKSLEGLRGETKKLVDIYFLGAGIRTDLISNDLEILTK